MEITIEISENHRVIVSDWVYDAIINRTISEIRVSEQPELFEYLQRCRRENGEMLSFNYFDAEEYKIVTGFFRQAYNRSKEEQIVNKRIFRRKYYHQFLREYNDLMYQLIKDERFYI